MADAPRVKIDRKSAISLQRGQFDPKFQIERVAPPIIFARIDSPKMPYNSVADSFHTDFPQGKCDFTRKTAILRC